MKSYTSPVYAKQFFEVQLALARKIASLLGQPLEQMVLHCTAFYRIFGLDWSLDPAHAVWQDYVRGLRQAVSDVDYSYQFYLARYDSIPRFSDGEHWGCFAYDYHDERRAVHIHFSNEDTSPEGPLSSQRIEARRTELRVMFGEIRFRHSEAQVVRGTSWLYNWECYRRLFPPVYGLSARPYEREGQDVWGQLPGRAIWGQFLRRNLQVHEETMHLFLQRVVRLERAEDYLQCFPYPVLRAEAPIQVFYDFY